MTERIPESPEPASRALRSGSPDPTDLATAARVRTPARVLVGRTGSSLPTSVHLELLQDHAAAVDAVHAEIELERDLGRDLVVRWRLFEVRTRARSKAEHLMRPDLGRQLDDEAVTQLGTATRGADLQVAIGDGLSAAAVAAQVPVVLPLLDEGARRLGWSFGRPFFIRHCRVGVLNDIGELLAPRVAVLLIGERPGLRTALSLSAYMAYAPRAGHTDAHRNLVSNIHAQGTPPDEAAGRILRLAEQMLQRGAAGVALKEELPRATRPGPRLLPEGP